jgi:uncharacterized protein YkwD
MERGGYRGFTFGENIAMGQQSVPTVMEAWIRSTGHYQNLTYGRFTDVGLGATRAKDGTLFWVQNFGAGGSCR